MKSDATLYEEVSQLNGNPLKRLISEKRLFWCKSKLKLLAAILFLFLPITKLAAQNTFDLYLVSVPETKRITVIQAIATVLPGISPVEIVDILKSLPTPILEGATKIQCEAAARKLEDAGAKVQITGSRAEPQQNLPNPSGGIYNVFLYLFQRIKK